MNMIRFGLATAFVLATSHSSFAVTAEVARACNALVAKQFPSRQVGNPAAGSSKGSAKEQRVYFEKCLANGGKMESDAAKDSKDGKSN